MQDYMGVPTERDNQGRVDEPDFASTSVFGPAVQNCVVYSSALGKCAPDSTLPPTPAGQDRFLAPGCTDDSGRQPSGSCGLYTVGASAVPAGTAGTTGMSGSRAPGRFTPSKGDSVTFLANVVTEHLAAPSQRMVDYNHQLSDSGVGPAVSGATGTGVGGSFLAGPVGEWLWFGDWKDKNGNGVIDHNTAPCNNGESCVTADNEFVWRGNCVDFAGIYRPDAIVNGYCAPEAGGAYAYDWVFPGNHHGNCGGGLILGGDLLLVGCFYTPNDLPGVQAYCTAKLLAESDAPPLVVVVENQAATPHFCPNSVSNMDGYSTAEFGFGDFVLDNTNAYQGLDFSFNDRSGDPSATTRHWSQNTGWGQYYWDTSIISTTVKVAADFDHAGDYNLANAKYADVDTYTAFSPILSDLFQGAQGTVSGQWKTARDLSVPVNNVVQGQTRNAAINTDPVVGPTQYSVQDPGLSHEPNTAGDSYPGAVRNAFCSGGDAQHNGWCSDYAGYESGPNAWLDIQAQRIITDNIAFTWNPTLEQLLYDTAGDNLENEVGVCVQCTNGPGAVTTISLGPRAAGDHSRSLDPGQYTFIGAVGLWNDKPETVTEKLFDPVKQEVVTNSYVVPADGWIGSIVDTTGYYQYRGYSTADCTIGGVAGTFPYAFCHPYSDGTVADPNAYTSGNLLGEWSGQCQVPNTFVSLTVTPDNGVWSAPTFKWKAFEQYYLGQTPEDFTGTSTPIQLDLECFDVTNGVVVTGDQLLLPEGNFGMPVHTTLTAHVQNGAVLQTVTDVDAYKAFA